jgi:hypothetical protein
MDPLLIDDPAQTAVLLQRRRITRALDDDVAALVHRVVRAGDVDWESPAARGFRAALGEVRDELGRVRAALEQSAWDLARAASS